MARTVKLMFAIVKLKHHKKRPVHWAREKSMDYLNGCYCICSSTNSEYYQILAFSKNGIAYEQEVNGIRWTIEKSDIEEIIRTIIIKNKSEPFKAAVIHFGFPELLV